MKWGCCNVADDMLQTAADSPPQPSAGAIVDNREGTRVGDFLKSHIMSGSQLSFVSAYFSIYAYAALRDELENSGRLRFLYGEPLAVRTPDPSIGEHISFFINQESDIELREALKQKPLAQACADWIRRKVDIRSIKQANFLHGKLYHIANGDENAALMGSSNFTRRGLGYGSAPNIELNLDVRNAEDRAALLKWFDGIWKDDKLTHDVKGKVLAELERYGKYHAPEFVYYKTLFHVFSDWLDRYSEKKHLLDAVHIHDTVIWKRLYEFQRDGAISAINRLMRHNGCIIADSVGLGKTWTALAVIKFFELRNERVLVLCPKRLLKNWQRYAAWAGSKRNIFVEDRLSYTLLAHTDLSRYEGKSGRIDLAEFNWSSYDLVVIDESHNFRNEGNDKKDEDGNVTKRSRYNRLMEEALKGGVKTKVLMLSATPVNTSLRDLRNQIYLMTEKRRDAFQKELGIGDMESMFKVAQTEFHKWEKQQVNNRGKGNGSVDKAALLGQLGADFLSLLDAVSFARSREHLRLYYSDEMGRIGDFPIRHKPKNLHPPTDSQGELSYDDLHERIGGLRLALYQPSQYLLDDSDIAEEQADTPFKQRDREKSLVGMMRVNLLKRLESSVHSFAMTLDNILGKAKELEQKMERWRQEMASSEKIDATPAEDEEDEDFVVGKGRQYSLEELDVNQWQQRVREDREVLERLRDLARRVDVERDCKLAELKVLLQDKVNNPTVSRHGRENRKALVFTTFSDTARYIYENLEDWVTKELKVNIALVTGGGGNRSSIGKSSFDDLLVHFAPKAQQRDIAPADEISILIATDCLSEGQNLQDCDLVINYDIHWNPVRLLQRFGRIDRLGSANQGVGMVNFWPTEDLNRYLNLKHRVEARMALADAAATGLDDPLNKDEQRELTQTELDFRDQQLTKMRDEIIDLEDNEIGLNDLTLDDFIADLMRYIQKNQDKLKHAPLGICAITSNRASGKKNIAPGVIFCLRREGKAPERTPNRLWPYFLVHIDEDGNKRYSFRQAQQCLAMFRALAEGQQTALAGLENAFDQETNHGQHMDKYNKLLDSALRDIAAGLRSAALHSLTQDRDAALPKASAQPSPDREFSLVTWLVIKEQE